MKHPLGATPKEYPDTDPRRWIRYALRIASRYRRRTSLSDDDLASAAMFGVCEACARLDPDNGGAAGYIALWVRGEISKAILSQRAFGPSRQVENAPQQEPLSDLPEPQNDSEIIEEFMARCCDTDLDRRVVLLRLKGFNDAEIALATNMSRQSINLIRETVEQNYVERLEGQVRRTPQHAARSGDDPEDA